MHAESQGVSVLAWNSDDILGQWKSVEFASQLPDLPSQSETSLKFHPCMAYPADRPALLEQNGLSCGW